MRVKEVPKDVIEGGKKLLSNKWVLYGGIAGAVVLGYLYLQSQNANAANSGSGTVSFSDPIQYGVAGAANAGTGSATVSSGGSGSSGGLDPNVAAAIALQQQQDASNQTLSLAQIQAESDAAIASDQMNLQLGQIAGIASNYAQSAGALSTFIKNTPGKLANLTGFISPSGNGGLNVDLADISAVNKHTFRETSQTYASAIPTLSALIGSNAQLQPVSTQPVSAVPVGKSNTTTGQTSPSSLVSSLNSSLLASGQLAA